jgi:peptide/nickel transport system substrate-binding protein
VLYTLLASRANGRGEVNVEGYANPAMDALVQKIGVETDRATRNAMIDEAAKILQQDLPVIPLHQQVIVWAAKQNIELAQPADDFFPYRYVTVK